MSCQIILASDSTTRQRLLRDSGVTFDVVPARVDEHGIRQAMLAEATPARDIADCLAEAKACKVSGRFPDALVLGCDQVLEFAGAVIGKPSSRRALRAVLTRMNGKTHCLHSAAVICQGGKPLWRHTGTARMHMRDCSPRWLGDYIDAHWYSIRHAAGGYHLETEGVRLFSRIEGDFFTVLGLPLIEVLFYLTTRGAVPG